MKLIEEVRVRWKDSYGEEWGLNQPQKPDLTP